MPSIGPIEQKATRVYLPKWKYNELSSRLRLEGSDVTKWFRERVDEELAKPWPKHPH